MAEDNTSITSSGFLVRWIAVASTAIYTIFVVIVRSGGSEASYQTTLWVSWAAITLVAAVTFGMGMALRRNDTESSRNATDDQVPMLT
ncbi:MAG: hypothetical protein ACC683_03820, partial [Acidimicrobiia bacterium]